MKPEQPVVLVTILIPKTCLESQYVNSPTPGKRARKLFNLPVHAIHADVSEPSHSIIHCRTNNVVNDSAEICATKIENLAQNKENKFPNVQIGITGLLVRVSIALNSVQTAVNEKIKTFYQSHDFSYIDSSAIDESCSNGSELHFNGKGTSVLATHFIKFLEHRLATPNAAIEMIGVFRRHFSRNLGKY